LTTAYHPQADSQTEIMNQILEMAFRAYANSTKDNWHSLIPGFSLTYNTAIHTATGFSPAYLLCSFQPLKSSNLLAQTGQAITRPSVESPKAAEFEVAMIATRRQAQDALRLSQVAQQKYYNQGHKWIEFKEGDLVLINPHSLNLLRDTGKGKKLQLCYDGLFEVLQKVSDVAYRLRLPASYKIHLVINIAHLESYHKDPDNIDHPKKHLNRADFDDLPEYEVEAILKEKWFKVKKWHIKKYWVKFVGYGPEWNEWLTKQALRNAPDILLDWEQSQNLQSWADRGDSHH
jgi:hypothetical protein